jgi:dolichol-phosphate mannosyltransferase
LIPELIKQWRSGLPSMLSGQNALKNLGEQFLAYWFYRILRKLADVEIPTDTGDFLFNRSIGN